MRALGPAHPWRHLLDEQRATSVVEIAEAEGIDVTQVRRVMRLTLLAPQVVNRLVGSPDAVPEKMTRRPWPIFVECPDTGTRKINGIRLTYRPLNLRPQVPSHRTCKLPSRPHPSGSRCP